MQWYFIKDGERVGPLSQSGFLARVKDGEIVNDTLVWNETMKDWAAYADIPDSLAAVLAGAGGTGESKCAMCGHRGGAEEMIEFEGKKICAACKPEFLQHIAENAEIRTMNQLVYAGFWRRYGAVILDGLIMIPVSLPFSFGYQFLFARADEGAIYVVAAVVCYLLGIIFPALYSILMIGKCGATVGKKALGIKVVMADGSRLSYGRATGRYFAFMLSGIILYIGYIMAAFDSEKRALHDHICQTRVVIS